MRWRALDVDYELYGKDLVDSIRTSEQISKILGKSSPIGFNYELFLDENEKKNYLEFFYYSIREGVQKKLLF